MRGRLTNRDWSSFLLGRNKARAARAVNIQPLQLEALEPRYLLSGMDGFGPPPVATDGHYLTHDTAVVARNMITDDTGYGTDTTEPLIVTEINGQPFEPGAPITLASGASLAVHADGSFVYDPSKSPTLGNMLPGAPPDTDSFVYTVAARPTDVIVFGDSLTDVGTMYQLTGGAIPPFPYVDGHFSNGPVWVEQMAPRLDLVSTLDNNYAVGGAGTGRNNVNQDKVPPELDLPGLHDEIDQFLIEVEGQADPDALYIVWAGPNDFFGDMSEPEAVMATAVNNIVTAVAQLQNAGAEHIVVPNMVDLGQTPYAPDGGEALLSYLSLQFNSALGSALGISAPRAVQINVFPLLSEIVNSAASYGFTNVTEPCFDGNSLCGNPDDYLFWDVVHPTTKGHAVLAEAMFDMLMESPLFTQTDTATVKVSVSDFTTPAVILDDNLYVGGTGASDRVFLRSDALGRVQVLVNYTHLGAYELDPSAQVIVCGHDGDDWIYGSALSRSMILEGGQGNDLIFGGSGADILRGGAGTDFLYGNAGADTLSGDDGDDFLYGGLGDDTIFGGSGNDCLFGGEDDDDLYGEAGNDRLFGQLGDDTLDGGDDIDWLFGGLGIDVLVNGEWSVQ